MLIFITFMIPDFVLPHDKDFKGSTLDSFLALGYYRMQHLLFTTNETMMDTEEKSFPVFWLRTKLAALKENRTAKNIKNKCSKFSISITTASVEEEHERLYAAYKKNIHFNTSEKCADFLEDIFLPNPFNSLMIEVRDKDKLIAVGYFDIGSTSIAGIMNFYNPQYQHYSLGKYLMLLKINYAMQNNYKYYYTGYISTATDKFDYKLFPDSKAIEVYLPHHKKWVPYLFMDKQLLEEYYINYLI